jgi:hypothetical protein
VSSNVRQQALESVGVAVLFHWATFSSLLVGLLYLLCSYPSAPFGQRLLAAAYGPSSAVLFLTALLVPQPAWPKHFPLYLLLQALPLALLVLSLRSFADPRWVHWVLVPLALVCLAWQAAWGHILIHGM